MPQHQILPLTTSSGGLTGLVTQKGPVRVCIIPLSHGAGIQMVLKSAHLVVEPLQASRTQRVNAAVQTDDPELCVPCGLGPCRNVKCDDGWGFTKRGKLFPPAVSRIRGDRLCLGTGLRLSHTVYRRGSGQDHQPKNSRSCIPAAALLGVWHLPRRQPRPYYYYSPARVAQVHFILYLYLYINTFAFCLSELLCLPNSTLDRDCFPDPSCLKRLGSW